MPWNEADRERYNIVRERYTSDLSDEEYALIEPLLPQPKRRGRKPTPARTILNAIFYLARCACPWRYMPKDFPPYTTVQNRFYQLRDSGILTQIICLLVQNAREQAGREAAPTAVIVDAQSVKTAESGGPRGYDAGKKVKGRKRHIAVDTLGLPIECQITPADVQDRDALAPILRSVKHKSPWVKVAFADGGYNGDEAQRAAFEASRIEVVVVKRTDKKNQRLRRSTEAMDRRTDPRLDQPLPQISKRLRGHNRIGPRLDANCLHCDTAAPTGL